MYAGYLNTSTDRGRNWSKQWYNLQEDFVMYAFKAHQNIHALSALPLPGHEVEKVDDLERPYVFKLHHKNRDVYHFQADGENKLKE